MVDENRTTRVARALCAADGHDPEADVTVGTEGMMSDISGISYRRTTKGPAWTNYLAEARRLVAALRALGLLE